MFKQIKQIPPFCPVIIMTAYGDVETAIGCVNNHAYGFLPKPLDFEKLLDMIYQIDQDKRRENAINYQKLKKAYQDLENAYNHLYEIVKEIEKNK